MSRTALYFAFTLVMSQPSFAAVCKIKVEDVNKGTTYNIEESFKESAAAGNYKKFDAPGSDYDCTLAFFTLKAGTMLSCSLKKDGGKTFYQSDRSTIEETNPRNKLAFRQGSAHLSIDVICK